MAKKFNGTINVDIRDSKPDWTPYEQPKAAKDAPNVLYIVWDDVGFATMNCFGGLVDTPNMDRIAKMGLRYTQWHTTALCSPTRSCLLTGRNAHKNGMACICEATTGFPGKNGHIPFENATIAEVLSEQGYNTYMVGKWHLCPEDEMNMASTKRNWPLGRGFERYYGFIGGETNQWYPDLIYDNHPVEQPALPQDGYHFSKDIADKAIEFIADAKQIAKDKPFFMYFCPGAQHAPHQIFKEWADKYKGKFDMGYEKYREQVMDRMKKMGLIPKETEISPINPMEKGRYVEADYVKPWNTLSEDEKKLFARMAEVYAGFMSYTDAQIGRLLDSLEESGQLDNTIIVACSDNGASGEGSPDGTVNENKFFNSFPDSLEENLKMIDELGGVDTYNHMPTGWAMAFCTPFKMFKRYSYNGGICDPLIISWPKGIKEKGGIRDQYHHAIDIVPTILDCIGIEIPDEIKGYTQEPIQGVSMRYSFDKPKAPTARESQYYEMLGQRGMYNKGWKVVTDRAPTPVNLGFTGDKWELYHVDKDRSEIHNVAEQYPEKQQELINLWWVEAGKNNVLPLDDRTVIEIFGETRPSIIAPKDSYTYYPGASDVPEGVAVNMRNRSFSIEADVNIESDQAEGVLFSFGTRFGGQSLFIKDKKLHYVYNFLGMEEQRIISDKEAPIGKTKLKIEFKKTGENPQGTANGDVTLRINNKKVAKAKMKTQPGKFGLGGGLSIGQGGMDPVTKLYADKFPFTGGTIKHVKIDVKGKPYTDPVKETERAMKND
jgi:arylsulfatase A-like enzyme